LRVLRRRLALSLLICFFQLQMSAVVLKRQIISSTDFNGRFRASPIKGLEEAYLPVSFRSSHAANLLLLQNGGLLCFWFSGSEEGESNVAIVMSKLWKGSSQWSKTVEIDHQPGKSFQNPVAFQTAEGRIWLLHTSQTAEQGQADAQILYLTSDDDGRSWTNPKVLFAKRGSFTRHPPLLLTQSEWLLPIYYTPSGSITHGAESHYSAIERTEDGGQGWKECRVPKSQGLVQPSLVRLDDKAFVAFFRSRYADFIYKSSSRDGCLWSTPVTTRLPNNNSSIQVSVLKDRHLVLVFNNSSAGDARDRPKTASRKPLSIALSEDGGNTWPWVRDLDGGSSPAHPDAEDDQQEYSYPSVLQDTLGKINVAYTYLRTTIKVVRFDEDWIRRGNTVGKFRGDRPE
jgi:predicted neuraminidase